MIWESEGIIWHLKQTKKKGEGYKARELNFSKVSPNKFRMSLLKSQDNKRSSFCQPRASRWVPRCHKENRWRERISAWTGF